MLQTVMERLSEFYFLFFSKPERVENAIIWRRLRTWYGRLLVKGPLAAAHFS
jgi:hypothetical protein